MLSVKNLRKVYKSKKSEAVVALNNVSIDFPETGFVFLLGKSGSGKSTLLNAIGGLDKFDGGEIIIKGKSSKDFSQSDFDSYRNTFIGFIFQEYNILENFTVAKNLALALELQHKKADKAEVMRLLNQVDMQNYANRRPNELSGGQKQRVAIARALIKNPEIIMADEPTGALDSNTGKQVMDTLKELSKTKLVIVVSHDREFAEIYGDRIIELKDGNIISDVTKKEIVAQETKSGIKIIDNDIVYIKKGQEVSANELKAISEIISNKTKDSDAFISFNEKANQKLKEGAKINDSGNKEKFVDTEKDDIKIKEYNPNSLKLIRSHLGFKDSFKMGASSLKNKVGKLIFTILLSFFAFTVFGIVDALSCWNRADSVYHAMQMTNQTSVVMKKEKKISSPGYSYNKKCNFSESDIAMFNEKFPDYLVKPGVDVSYDISDIKIVLSSGYEKDLISTKNPFKTAGISGVLNISDEELQKLGFKLDSGRLPTADDEIAISKFNAENIVYGTSKWTGESKITLDNVIGQKITFQTNSSSYGNSNFKIVGIIDDGTDFSKYNDLNDDVFSDYQKYYQYKETVQYSFASIAYVTKNTFKKFAKDVSSDSLQTSTGSNSYYSFEKKSILTFADIAENVVSRSSTRIYKNKSLNATLTILKDYSNTEYRFTTGSNYYNWTEGDTSVSTDDKSTSTFTINELNSVFPGFLKNENHIPNGFVADYSATKFFTEYMDSWYGDKSNYIDENDNLKLADDEVILVKNRFYEGVDDAIEKIKAGTMTITVSEGYNESSEIKTLKVVGLTNYNVNSSSDMILSEKTATELKGYFGEYSFAVSKLNNSGSDKDFVYVCEKFSADNVKYTIQNAQTSTLDSFEGIISSTAQIFLYIAIAFAVFAAMLLMNFISTSISYKKREIGVLRALGARGSDVFGIFLNESLLIATINFVLAAVATIIGGSVINNAIISKLGVTIPLINVGVRQLVLILAVSWGSAFIASLIPTTKISRKKPIDAINNR